MVVQCKEDHLLIRIRQLIHQQLNEAIIEEFETMLALYAEADDKEIKISGTENEWQTLAEVLLIDKGEVKCKTADPSPYSIALSKISVQHNKSNKVTIDINSKGNICISGSPVVCKQLSKLVWSFASEYLSGDHFHLDAIDSHFMGKNSAFVILHME
jgi:hypothetical protein